MIVFLNGQFVPEDQAVVSVFDRSFLYGDGVFETLRVYNGQPFRWGQHLDRLQRGAQFLRIPMPFAAPELHVQATELLHRNHCSDAILRLHLSRGTGRRGFSTHGANQPLLVMSLHPAPALDPLQPPQWRLITSSLRLPANDPLARFKTCNQLVHLLARAEAETQGAQEALLLNTHGMVAEAASGNLFWLEGMTMGTPPLASGVLPGVTRALVFDLCQKLGLPCLEESIELDRLKQADAAFLTLSTWEIVEVVSLDGAPLPRAPQVEQLRRAYRERVRQEVILVSPRQLVASQ